MIGRPRPIPEHPQLLAAGVSPLLARLYAARGVTLPQQLDYRAQALLGPQLDGLAAATAILRQARDRQSRVLVVGDYDCDGATATALMVWGLRGMGFVVDFLVPHRVQDGYGLSPALVARAEAFDPQVLITVDNGINSIEGVAAARARGWQVIVTDHHLPGPVLPGADALINPQLPTCSFPSKHLAGVGVAFYLLLALRRALGSDFPLSRGMDLVALGTVADLVRLDDNNRRLVQLGLGVWARHTRPGLAALAAVAGVTAVTPEAIGFRIGPRLNAAGRMDDMRSGIRLLLTEDPEEAAALAAELDEHNRTRRSVEAGMCEHLLAAAQAQAADRWSVVVFDPDGHEGVIGIVASRLRERVNRPVIVLAPGEHGLYKGSARSIAGFHLRDALADVAAQDPQLLPKFGGHAMAAGLSLPQARLADFQAAFEAVVRRRLDPQLLDPVPDTDGELPASARTLATVALLGQGGPWGQGFPAPSFEDEFTVREARLLKDAHVKFKLAGNEEAIWFNASLKDWAPGQRVRLLYVPERNDFNGVSRVQLRVLAAQPD